MGYSKFEIISISVVVAILLYVGYVMMSRSSECEAKGGVYLSRVSTCVAKSSIIKLD